MSRQHTLAVKGIIFDMDGTLADSVEYFYTISLEVLNIAGVPRPSRTECLSSCGRRRQSAH